MTPDGWSRATVGDLGAVEAGKAKDAKSSAPARPYLRVANVFDGRIDVRDVLSMPFSDTEFERHMLHPGDVLLNEGQSLELVGRCSMYRGEFGQPCAIQNALIRFRAGDRTLPEFAEQLFRWSQQSNVFAQIATQTTSIAHLGVKRFADLEVLVPPPPEQRKIAVILSSVDEVIEKTDAVIKHLRVVKKSVMQELLTRGFPGRHTRFKQTEIGELPEEWDIVPLGDVIRRGPDNGLYRPKSHYGSGTPIVRIDSFGMGDTLPPAGFQRVALGEQDVARFQLQPGDVVINRVNSLSHLAKAAFVKSLDEPTVFESNMMRVTLEPTRVLPRFAFHWVSSEIARSFFFSHAKQAVAQASVNQQDVKSLPLPLPPLAEQERLAGTIDGILRRIEREENYRSCARATKTTLMSVLLTGELRVTPEEDAA